jgi:ATP:corrinoid adenosyltransferase
MNEWHGLVMVFTGRGKGKTTAALRATGAGLTCASSSS